MRHIHPVSSQQPATAATLLTKAQAISNAMDIVQVGQEALALFEQAVGIFTKDE